MKKLLSLLLVLAMLLSVSACALAADASPDNDLVVAMMADATHLDPHVSTNGFSNQITNTMYETLVAFDEHTNIVPSLATEWSVSEDALTYTFTLREGVKFHDGESFNAEAVKAVYDRYLRDDTLMIRRTLQTWTGVEVLDEYKVAITLQDPNNTFMNKITQLRMISPKAMAMENASDYLAKNSAGTGPFVLAERVDGGYTKVVPFADYWAEGPTVDSLTFMVVPEDGARIAMLQTGEADVISPVPVTDVAQIEGAEGIQVNIRPTTTYRYVTLNTEWTMDDGRKPFADKRVRQALNYAFDSDAYAKVVFNGYAKAPTSIFSDSILYFAEQTPYTPDIDKAKSLMAEAGFADGFTVEIVVDNTTLEQRGATFVQQQLSQIGVNVVLLANESTVNAEITGLPLEEATVQMWYVNWSSGSYEADGSMRSILHGDRFPPAGYNTAFWNNAEFNQLLDDALKMTDTAQIADTYAKAQAIAWEECPWMFLGNDNVLNANRTYVTGMEYKPGDEIIFTRVGLTR